MKIAIIGAGISGLTAAYYLSRDHEVTVLEAEPEIGGHTATKKVEVAGRSYNIDTGFIVYNDWTYPNFIALMNELGVAGRPSEMSFSVSCENTGLEYAGSSISTLFADRKNLLRPSYWKMLKDIVRFNREALEDLERGNLTPTLTLGDYLAQKNYGKLFEDKYLLPMGAAIWSSTTGGMADFPALFFVRFFKNHGLLSVKNRPQWHTLIGGSRSYLEPLTRPFKDSIVTGVTISSIVRAPREVTIQYSGEDGVLQIAQFDAIVLACHSDQALELLSDATESEKSILSAIAYRRNEVVLHTDITRLPKRRKAWSSWNYRLMSDAAIANSNGSGPDVMLSADKNEIGILSESALPKLTYSMNILQGIESETEFCVSLNQTSAIDASKILGTYHYSHPVFTADAIAAQSRWSEIAGKNKTWFCGAYWANGFHEDGVVSALRVVESLGDLIRQKGAEVA